MAFKMVPTLILLFGIFPSKNKAFQQYEECDLVETETNIRNIINLNDYPIHDPLSHEALELMQKSHETFIEDGIVTLSQFLFRNVAKELADQVMTKRDIMCECNVQHNIYQYDDDDPLYNNLHPRNAKMHSKFHNLPYDDIPQSSMLHTAYNWDLMTRFVSAIVYGNVSDPRLLYRFDDPLCALTANLVFNGNIIDWHFDQAPFAVIILLQNGDFGGEYEVGAESLYLNDTAEYDYNLHDEIINEINSEINIDSYLFQPGDLVIHRGIHSIHRVNTVIGDKPRITAVFTYAPRPNMTLSPTVRYTTYCRDGPRDTSK